MGTHFKSISMIDITALVEKYDDPEMAEDADVLEVVRQLDQACREAGFFYVKGHGIPESLLKEAREVTREFMHQPIEDKLKIKLSAATGYRGYHEVGHKETKDVPDNKEVIDFYREWKHGLSGDIGRPMEGPNLWPDNPKNFKSVMEQYIDLCTELVKKILRGIALALGGSIDELEGKIAGDLFWVLRGIGYPVASKENGHDKSEVDIGCAPHTDYGFLTLLNQDEDITALQVRSRSGEWIWVPPIPGTFVCNLGDMLEILTNGLYESTLHQVFNSAPKYRVCLAYYQTTYYTVIEPLDICVQKSGGIKKLGGAIYGENLCEHQRNSYK